MGKVWDLLTHPSELRAVVQWYLFRDPLNERDPSKESANLRRCYELLHMTSRSFVMVIQELQPELREPVPPPLPRLNFLATLPFRELRFLY